MMSANWPADITCELLTVVREVVPRWMETQRWFGDKGRLIASVALLDLFTTDVGEDLLALAVVGLDFAEGDHASYFLPLVITRTPRNASMIATMSPRYGQAILVDATEVPWFGNWLLAAMTNPEGLRTDSWRFESLPEAQGLVESAKTSHGSLMSAEQSNSSLRFGDALVVKLFRRLQPGPHPDEEVLRGLTAVRYPRVPAFAGSGSWYAAGATYPIAIAQAFVPNLGDGWSWTLARLAEAAPERGSHNWSFEAEALLGVHTAELHIALSGIDEASFLPIVDDGTRAAQEMQRAHASLESVITLLDERARALPDTLQLRLSEILSSLQKLSPRFDGFREGIGLPRIRVHGDFHLGQTLRTLDHDWTIIDFEGEPTRPIAERRQRTSPLKDVAGMLRSYGYARGVAGRSRPYNRGREQGHLDDWERGARAAFLQGYRETMQSAGTDLIPADDEAFARALDAWELDKALYEIAYEARNRPDWLDLPLRSLMPEMTD